MFVEHSDDKFAAVQFGSFGNELTIVLTGSKLVMRVNFFGE